MIQPALHACAGFQSRRVAGAVGLVVNSKHASDCSRFHLSGQYLHTGVLLSFYVIDTQDRFPASEF